MKTRLLFAAACLLAALSCTKQSETPEEVLSAPVLKLEEKTETSFKVVWEPVEGAEKYGYEFEGTSDTVTGTELSFTELEPGATYTLKVKSVSSESESEWAEIDVTLDEKQPEPFSFNMSVTSEGMTITVVTSPTDKEKTYYFEPVPKSLYEEFGSDAEALFTSMMSEYTQYYGSAAAAYEKICMKGDNEKSYDITKYAEEKFYVVIAGIDENLNVTTEVESAETDIELPVSDNTFEIDILELEQAKILVGVTPSNDDQYSIILQDTKTLDSMTETQLRSFISGLVGENNICSGETNMLYEKNIVPSHDYSILVFGWEGTFTTEINRKDFRTPDPEEVETLTFEMTVDVKGPKTAICKIVPSNEKASYFYDVASVEDWADKYQNDPKVYIEKMASDKNWTEVRYLTQFGSVGTQEYTYGKSYLKPDTEFVLFAIGYQIEGEEITYLEPQQITFSTPAE